MRPLICRLAAGLAAIVVSSALAQTGELRGLKLADYLDALNRQGVRVLYSNDLVTDRLVVTEEPVATDSRARLTEILRPHGLSVVDGPAGSLLVVRTPKMPDTAADASAAQPGTDTRARIDEIIVTSSLHRLQNLHTAKQTYLDRELATRIPTVGEEVARLTHRLPGSASGGISARGHVRGGETNEVLYLLDGVRLYEPFHLKDFQSISTIVNSAVVSGLDYYTGGYPARFGDRMSGVVSMSVREPVRDIETEIGISFFNTSVLSLGRFGEGGRGEWLAAARRGNLDLVFDVVDSERGSPAYQDVFVRGGWQFGDRHHVSATLLGSHDKIALADLERGEQADAKYDNRMLWLKWGTDWSERLFSDTVVALTDIRNRRRGSVALPDVVAGSVDEERDFRVLELRQDWRYLAGDRLMFSGGVTARRADAEYRYQSTKTIAPPFDAVLDNRSRVDRAFDVAPGGAQFVAHGSLRLNVGDKLTFDAGLRWDQQTYTTADNDTQISPRASFLYRLGDLTEVRLGWGRYYQAQEINELQVEDGSAAFFPAQRAEHLVLDVERTLPRGIGVDLSVYRKKFRSLRPRYENVFDTLTLLPELGIDRVRIDAVSAEARGAELLLSQGDSDSSTLWWLGYAWAEVRDQTPSGKIKRSWDQTHTVNFGASRRWGLWNLSVAGQVHTGWPKTELRETASAATAPGVEATDRNALRYSVFHTLDFRLSREFDVSRGNLTVSLDVTNVYDRDNPCCTEYAVASDQSGAGRLRAVESNWLPLVPSIGVLWRF